MRGQSLIEVVMTMALLFLVLVLCGNLAVLGMRTRMRTEDKNQGFREATVALDELNRDLLQCSDVLMPAALTAGTAIRPETAPFVFRTQSTRGASPLAVVGYRLDRPARTLTRLVYEPTFNPGVTSTHVLKDPPQVVARLVDDFTLTRRPPGATYGTPVLRTEMQVGPTLRLTTDSSVRGL